MPKEAKHPRHVITADELDLFEQLLAPPDPAGNSDTNSWIASLSQPPKIMDRQKKINTKLANLKAWLAAQNIAPSNTPFSAENTNGTDTPAPAPLISGLGKSKWASNEIKIEAKPCNHNPLDFLSTAFNHNQGGKVAPTLKGSKWASPSENVAPVPAGLPCIEKATIPALRPIEQAPAPTSTPAPVPVPALPRAEVTPVVALSRVEAAPAASVKVLVTPVNIEPVKVPTSPFVSVTSSQLRTRQGMPVPSDGPACQAVLSSELTHDMYPDLPAILFEHPHRSTFGMASGDRINTVLLVKQMKGGFVECTMTATINGTKYQGCGSRQQSGGDARPAMRLAYFDLLDKLHARGLLRPMFEANSQIKSEELPPKYPGKRSPEKLRRRSVAPAAAQRLPMPTIGTSIDLKVHPSLMQTLMNLVEDLEKQQLPALPAEAQAATTELEDPRGPYLLTGRQHAERDEMHLNRLNRIREGSELAKIRKIREELPMMRYREQVLDLVNNNVYSIIIGATGSGKTTQVPQLILEAAAATGHGSRCNIICTQPRRIAATSVARRVAEERGETLQSTVGYSVRFDSKLPSYGGSIAYCTTGVLLQRLQGSADDVLGTYSHIIMDEVHVRDILIDFLLNLLKQAMRDRIRRGSKPIPRVVLMSATLDTELFAKYFGSQAGGVLTSCPSLSVPGRTFPVADKYLDTLLPFLEKQYLAADLALMREDIATQQHIQAERAFEQGERKPLAQAEREDALVPIGLIVIAIAGLAQAPTPGAILVFLPGIDDIEKVDKLLCERQPLGLDFMNPKRFKIFKLHSSLPSAQKDVFLPLPPKCRKVILATNIAETSITLPDIVHVIDTGKVKEKRYDPLTRISRLQCVWISQSSSKQRAGRAGRVRNGNYYALFTKTRHQSMRRTTMPEMMRSNLQELCLAIKAHEIKVPVRDFLAASIEPPLPAAVDSAIKSLEALDALTVDEKLTSLGQILAKLPVAPSLGKMLLLGIIFRCFDPLLILAAASADRPLFRNHPERKAEVTEARHKLSKGTDSDQYAIINAVRKARFIKGTGIGVSRARDFMRTNFISWETFSETEKVMNQVLQVCVEYGLIPDTLPDKETMEMGGAALNQNSDYNSLVKAAMVAGYHPNLAVMKAPFKGQGRGGKSLRTAEFKTTILHPTSLNTRKARDDDHDPNTIFCFAEPAKSSDGSNIFLRDTTVITPLVAALLGGKLTQPFRGSQLNLDRWVNFTVRAQDPELAAEYIMRLKNIMDRIIGTTFADLATGGASGSAYIHDDPLRTELAYALSDILDMDLAIYEQEMEARRAAREAERARKRAENDEYHRKTVVLQQATATMDAQMDGMRLY